MLSKFAKVLGAGLLMVALWSPAYGQATKNKPASSAGAQKPVVEYIVVVILLAIPIGLVCRSSRRST